MTNYLFQAWSHEASIPLTIAASDFEAAEEVYAEWRRIHAPHWSMRPLEMEKMCDAWLKERPQLADAIRRASEKNLGDCVLYFLDHDAGWIAKPTYSTRIGGIAPAEPLVQCYQVRVEKEGLRGPEVMLFARSEADAYQLYIDWHEEQIGLVGHSYTISPFSRWTLAGEQITLRKEMDLGMVGIAGWSSTGGYHIYPFDHELAGK